MKRQRSREEEQRVVAQRLENPQIIVNEGELKAAAAICEKGNYGPLNVQDYAELRAIASRNGLRLYKDYNSPEDLCSVIATRIQQNNEANLASLLNTKDPSARYDIFADAIFDGNAPLVSTLVYQWNINPSRMMPYLRSEVINKDRLRGVKQYYPLELSIKYSTPEVISILIDAGAVPSESTEELLATIILSKPLVEAIPLMQMILDRYPRSKKINLLDDNPINILNIYYSPQNDPEYIRALSILIGAGYSPLESNEYQKSPYKDAQRALEQYEARLKFPEYDNPQTKMAVEKYRWLLSQYDQLQSEANNV